MLLPFRLGVGGVLGSGDQFMSWITPDDLSAIILASVGRRPDPRTGQRRDAAPGHEPRIHEDSGESITPPDGRAGTGLCAASGAGRNGRCTAFREHSD